MHPENASKLISIAYFLIPINATQSLLFHREREAFGDQGYALASDRGSCGAWVES